MPWTTSVSTRRSDVAVLFLFVASFSPDVEANLLDSSKVLVVCCFLLHEMRSLNCLMTFGLSNDVEMQFESFPGSCFGVMRYVYGPDIAHLSSFGPLNDVKMQFENFCLM